MPIAQRFTLIALCVVLYRGSGFQPAASNAVLRGGVNGRQQDGAVFHKHNILTSKLPEHSSTVLTSAASGSAESDGEWTKKRLHNTQWFRSAAILLTLCAAGASQQSPLAMIPSRMGATINLFSFGMSFGTMFYTTFIFGITAFKNLPRQTFGKLQAKLFPKYFSLCSATILLQVRVYRK